MKIALINPNIVSQKDDVCGTGIPYMPSDLASLAAYLGLHGHAVSVIDAFGEAPTAVRETRTHFIQGVTSDEVAERVPSDVDVIGFFAHLTVTHPVNLEIIGRVRKRFPNVPTLVLENTTKVNSYSLRQVAGDFFFLGVDYVVLGFLEKRTLHLVTALGRGDRMSLEGLDGLMWRGRPDEIRPPIDYSPGLDLDTLPFPAWSLFPIENYWRIGYAHGPLTERKYLPLITSRGCPFNCGFCIAPEVTGRKWKARSADNVVEEIKHWRRTLGVEEFHIEDLNPSLDKKRMVRMSQLLIDQRVKVRWKLAQGTKLESLDEETVEWMARAGCDYISISPESGSVEVLKMMEKPVNLEHARGLVRTLANRGVYSQACFVMGYPGETRAHLTETGAFVRKLARDGVDEIALFIMTRMPGSRVYQESDTQSVGLDQMTFTPHWRSDYAMLSRARLWFYLQYILIKVVCHPLRTFGYFKALVTGSYRTKVEMTIARKIKVAWWALASRFVRRWGTAHRPVRAQENELPQGPAGIEIHEPSTAAYGD